MTTTNVYNNLAIHLDNLPGGFPKTESGVELRILKRLFTPEDAELATHLTLIPETARVVARRAKIRPEEAERRLEDMSRRGLIFRMAIREKPPEYIAMQFFIGIWEHQVNNLNPEFIRDMEEYGPILFNHKTWKKTPQLRTIPVRQSITPQLEVMSYEKAEEMVWDKKRAVVAPCICRRERKIMGEGCEKPEDACLVFGMGAVYYQRNGFGRAIDRQEVLDILKTADKAGLVLQPGNSKDIANICCCCGCCCAILKNMKLHPRPAELVLSAFLAEIHTESCTGCGVCVKRCQMDALRLEGEKAILDAVRCIGCGLCVSTCPTKSLKLVRKPGPQPEIPSDLVEADMRMARMRGKLKTSDLIRMQVKSKIDRLLSIR